MARARVLLSQMHELQKNLRMGWNEGIVKQPSHFTRVNSTVPSPCRRHHQLSIVVYEWSRLTALLPP